MKVFGQRCCAGCEQVAVMALANPWVADVLMPRFELPRIRQAADDHFLGGPAR
jgi:hypothetical protein